jgi:HSP20 family protein
MANVPARRGGWPRRWRAGWPLEAWDPWADFAQIWERMRPLAEQGGETAPGEWVPLAETEDTGDTYVVRAELPGFQRDDIHVEMRGDELYITGEMRQEDKRENALRRRTGRFSYRTSLPGDADTEKIDAKLADGVLTVRVPKSAPARSRKIEISK